MNPKGQGLSDPEGIIWIRQPFLSVRGHIIDSLGQKCDRAAMSAFVMIMPGTGTDGQEAAEDDSSKQTEGRRKRK